MFLFHSCDDLFGRRAFCLLAGKMRELCKSSLVKLDVTGGTGLSFARVKRYTIFCRATFVAIPEER